MTNPKKSRPKERSGIGARITKFRLAAGLTQTELGEKTGMTCAMISYIERGKHEPIERTIRKICTALDITESCLHDAAGEWRLGHGGRVICPYCGKGQLLTVRDIEHYGYQLGQIRFCTFCGREVKPDDS